MHRPMHRPIAPCRSQTRHRRCPRRMGTQSQPRASTVQRRRSRRHPALRRPARALPRYADPHLRRGRRPARRHHGQLRGRPPEHRRRPRRRSGLGPHHQVHPHRRVLREPRAVRHRREREEARRGRPHPRHRLRRGRPRPARPPLRLCRALQKARMDRVFLHLFTDGRDTPPHRARSTSPTSKRSSKKSVSAASPRSAGAITPWTATTAGNACRRPTDCSPKARYAPRFGQLHDGGSDPGLLRQPHQRLAERRRVHHRPAPSPPTATRPRPHQRRRRRHLLQLPRRPAPRADPRLLPAGLPRQRQALARLRREGLRPLGRGKLDSTSPLRLHDRLRRDLLQFPMAGSPSTSRRR